MALPPFANDFMSGLRNNSDLLLQSGIGLLSGRTPQEQVAGAAQGIAGARQRNKTLDFLRSANPELAQAVESGALSGGDAYKLFYQQKLEAEKPKNNYITAGKNLYNVDTQQWIAPPAGMASSDEEWGLTPVWGEVNGKTVLGQVSKAGKFKPLDTGDFNPTPVIQNVDTGTAILGRNSRTGEVVTTTPKDLAGAERDKTVGGAQGQAIADLPAARANANLISSQIEDIKEDPYLDSMLGPLNSKLPNTSADAARVQGKLNQLQGGAFLQARQMLKGGGAITDFEGAKAEAAYARLVTAQNPKDFRDALNDFNDAVQQGVAKLEAAAGQGNQAPQAPAPVAPPSGSAAGVVDYRDYFRK